MRRTYAVGAVLVVALVGVLLLLLHGATELPPPSVEAALDPAPAPSRSRPKPPPVVVPPAVPGQLPAALFEGDVVSADGAGIGGAELVFEYRGAAATTHADARGHFVFSAEPPGEWSLGAISADGFAPFGPRWGESPIRLIATRGARVEGLRFTLARTMPLVGRVEDMQGQPVVGARVEVHVPSYGVLSDDSAVSTTDGAGAFALAVPRVSRFDTVHASHPDFMPESVQVRSAAAGDGGLVIRLERGRPGPIQPLPYRVRGVVLDERDARIPDVTVQARQGPTHSLFVGFSDDDGRFEVGVPLAGSWLLTANHSQYAEATVEADPSIGAPVVIRVRRHAAVLSGRVTTSSGAAPRSFTVWAGEVGDAPDEAPPRPSRLAAVGARHVTIVSSDGRYRLDELPEGRTQVVVTAPGFLLPDRVYVELEPGRERVADFVVRRGGTVTGRVVDRASRAPVQGASVRAEGAWSDAYGLERMTSGLDTTDADGGFTLVAMSPGRHDLTVSEPRRYVTRIVSGVLVPDDGHAAPVIIDLEPKRENNFGATEFEGIGVELQRELRDGGVAIDQLLPGGGARTAGLLPGDVIVAVEGAALEGLRLSEAMRLIRGPEGSVVRLTVLRDGRTFEVPVVRRRLQN